MYTPKVGETVEVVFDDAGFEDSFWEAEVLSLNVKEGNAFVRFKDLMEDDGEKHLEETHKISRIQPQAPDDCTTSLDVRSVGDPVDCWYDGGWWKGVIYIGCDDGVLVYFPATPTLEDIIGVTKETMEAGNERVRTAYDYNPKLSAWTRRPPEVLEGSHDYRKHNKVKVEEEEGGNEGEGPSSGGHHDRVTVADFKEGRKLYPIQEPKVPSPQDAEPSSRVRNDAKSRETRESSGKQTRLIPQRTKLRRLGASSATNVADQNEASVAVYKERERAPKSDARPPTSGRNCGDVSRKAQMRKLIPDQRRVRPAGVHPAVMARLGAGRGIPHRSRVHPSTSRLPQGGVKMRKVGQSLMPAPRQAPPGHISSKGQARTLFSTSVREQRLKSAKLVNPSLQPNLGPRRPINKNPPTNLTPSMQKIKSQKPVAPIIDRADLQERLNRRAMECRYFGVWPGIKICVDGLGWVFDEGLLESALKDMLKKVVRVDFASGQLFGNAQRYSAGFVCITFESTEDALVGMLDLDNCYISVPGCPVYRPLISHFPTWKDNPWGMEDAPGCIRFSEEGIPPHFCQANTIEFHSAVEWNHLKTVEMKNKAAICNKYKKMLVEEINKHKGHIGQPAFGDFKPVGSFRSKRMMWLKATSLSLSDDVLRAVFEQFDQCCKVHRLMDPVMRKDSGHVVVAFEDEEKAENVCYDMKKYLYLAGGAPRPLDVEIMKSGGPLGFEGVLDDAIESALGIKLSNINHKFLSHVKLRKFDGIDAKKKPLCLALRKILEKMAHERAALFAFTRDRRKDLHREHKLHFQAEIDKFNALGKWIERSKQC